MSVEVTNYSNDYSGMDESEQDSLDTETGQILSEARGAVSNARRVWLLNQLLSDDEFLALKNSENPTLSAMSNASDGDPLGPGRPQGE